LALALGSCFSGVAADSHERLIVKNGCSTDDIWMASSDNVPGGPVKQIRPGEQIKYSIPDGLASTRFWPKMFCNGNGQECLLGDSGGPGQQCAGIGCAPPVDSKFEATWGKAGGDCATDAHSCDWWDTSGVDGFTLPYKVELSDSCKSKGGVEIDCSQLTVDQCPTSEDVQNVGNVDLTLRHPSNQQVVGCYSPCAKLTTSNWNNPLGTHSPPDDIANPYCCPTPPVSSEQCRAGPADTMEYTQLIHAQCPHVYGYAYDDAVGLQTCPQDTIYTWTLYCPAGGSPPSPSPPPPPPPSPVWQPGQITPMADTGKCLDLVGGDTSNGTPIWLWDCNGNENQAWTFTSDSWMIVYQADTSKCIDAGDMSDGKQLQIWDCNGMDQQIWGFDADSSTIYLANSAGDASKCMDLAGSDTSAGNAIQIWDCNGEWNQQWYPPSDGGRAVTITLQSNTNICLDLPGGDTTDGTQVWVWDCNGMDSQKWIFAADSWQIQYAGDTSKCLDAGAMDGITQLVIWDCNGFSQQKWGYDQDSGSVYLADSATDASLCMDLAGDLETAGTTVSAYSCNSEPNQRWSIWDASFANGKATQQMYVV